MSNKILVMPMYLHVVPFTGDIDEIQRLIEAKEWHHITLEWEPKYDSLLISEFGTEVIRANPDEYILIEPDGRVLDVVTAEELQGMGTIVEELLN